MSPRPEPEEVDYLVKARRWMENDQYGSITGANATQITTYALMSIATDIRKLVEASPQMMSQEDRDYLLARSPSPRPPEA